LVEKESIEHEKAKKDIFKNGDPDKMGTPLTNQKSDSVQTNQVPLTKSVSSAKKGSGCLSVDLATATLQTKQVSLNKRDTPSNLEVGSSHSQISTMVQVIGVLWLKKLLELVLITNYEQAFIFPHQNNYNYYQLSYHHHILKKISSKLFNLTLYY